MATAYSHPQFHAPLSKHSSSAQVARPLTVEVKFRMNPTPDSPPLADGLSVQRLDTRVILSISWRNMAS
jgi:hypothetical protein